MLRPFSHISDLAVWDYFTREELRAGPAYDLEIAGAEAGAGLGAETAETADGSMISECGLVTRPSLTLGYDNLSIDHPDMVGGYKYYYYNYSIILLLLWPGVAPAGDHL